MPDVDPMKWRAIQLKYAAFTSLDERADYERGVSDAERFGGGDWEGLLRAGEARITMAVDADATAYKSSCLAEVTAGTGERGSLEARMGELTDRKIKLEASFSEFMNELAVDGGKRSAEYEHLRRTYESATMEHDELRAELGRPPVARLPPLFYWPLIVSIFFVEIPLNATALELLGELQRNYNWIFAFVAGLGFVGSSHLLGTNVRQIFGAPSWGGVAKRAAAILFFIVIIAGALGILAQLRDQVLHLQGQTAGNLAPSVGSVVGRSVETALTKWLVGISPEALQLAMLNVFIVCLASVLAFFHVDPDDRYDVATIRLARAAVAYEKHRRRTDAELKGAMEGFRKKREQLDHMLGEARRKVAASVEQIEDFRRTAVAGAKTIAQVRDRRLAAYRQGFLHGLRRPPTEGAIPAPEESRPAEPDAPAPTPDDKGAR